jgi:hypothetical protein
MIAVTQLLPERVEIHSIIFKQVAGGQITSTTKPGLLSNLQGEKSTPGTAFTFKAIADSTACNLAVKQQVFSSINDLQLVFLGCSEATATAAKPLQTSILTLCSFA